MATKERYIRPKDFLFREGDPSQSIFIIKKGTVAVQKRRGSAQIELARIFSGEVIGELSFFDRQPRSASAMALTEVEVLEIGFDSLEKIYASVPDYLKTIITAMAERLRKADETIKRLQGGTTEQKKRQAVEVKEDEPDIAAVLAAAPQLGSSDDEGGEKKS